MDFIKEIFNDIQLNSTIAIWLYWIPMTIALIAFIRETFAEYIDEKSSREKAISGAYSFYPHMTVGSVTASFLLCFIPFVNFVKSWSEIFLHLRKFVKIFDFELVKSYTPPKKN